MIESGLSVVIPAYNESSAIVDTCRSLADILRKTSRPFEIIVVDDGSDDGTGGKARETGVRVIQHPANKGYGRALLTGIDAATHETIVIVDADGTYPIEALPDLLLLYDRGFDMVVGSRHGTAYQPTWSKRILRMIFRFLSEFATGRPIPDINSGFRIMRRAPVLQFRASISTGFSFTTTVTLLFLLNGLFVGYTPVTYRSRVGTAKVRLLRDSLRSLQIVVTTIAQYNPLKLILLLVAAHLVVSAGMATLAHTTLILSATSWIIIAIAWNTTILLGATGVLVLAPRPSNEAGPRSRS